MKTSAEALPIDEVLEEIIERLAEDRAVVVEAPPGAGKSTRVPSAILDAPHFHDRSLVMLEPRRVAARAVASRIASQRKVSIGGEVGWHIRFDRRTSDATRLTVVTEGILNAQIQSNPFLEGVDVVVLDEFHERNIHTDLAAGFCRELLSLRDDFHVVVMSATLDARSVADFFGCRAVASRGRTYPVAEQWIDHEPEVLENEVARAVQRLTSAADDDGGDILVFLPGVREIDAAQRTLRGFPSLDILPLHGRLRSEEQDRALRAGPRRRVVLATNIAETSLTVEGVTAVVDSGLVRLPIADPATGFDRLDTRRVSLASATQRAGRAGRTAPGRAVKLWPRASEFRMPEYDAPEIARVDLTAAVLGVVTWSGDDPAAFSWFQPPPAHVLEAAASTLRAIGVLEREGWTVGDLGRRIGRMPLHPRIARYLTAADALGAGESACRVAACLSEADWVRRVSSDVPQHFSDAWLRAELLEEVARGDVRRARSLGLEVDIAGASRASRVAGDLRRHASSRHAADPEAASRRALLHAFADRIAVRRSERRYALTRGGSVVLGHESVVREPECLLALVAFGSTRADGVECAIVRQAAAVELGWIEEEFPERFSTCDSVEFDRDLERLVARRQRRLDDLVLSEQPIPLDAVTSDGAAIAEKLAAAAASDLASAFGLARESAQLLDRIHFLRRHMPELDLPDPAADEFLVPIVWGKTSFAELRKLDFVNSVRSQLGHERWEALERHAPQRWQLPSQRRFRIDYSDDAAPVLAAKLQDFFGLYETPRIAGGRVPLLLHLLAPNQRPAQVTTDLASFWSTTYREVRKELRARYPKHDWPEEP